MDSVVGHVGSLNTPDALANAALNGQARDGEENVEESGDGLEAATFSIRVGNPEISSGDSRCTGPSNGRLCPSLDCNTHIITYKTL